MCLYSRMFDPEKRRNSGPSRGHGCSCGDCLIGGWSCTDSGSHDACLCSRCGDSSHADRKRDYE